VSGLIQGILENVGFTHEEAEKYRSLHIIVISVIIVFPSCILKSVDVLRYMSLISIFAIFYTSVILIIELPFYNKRPDLQGELEWFKLNWGFFNAFGITFFAFTCQPGFFSAIEKLTKRDADHKTKVLFFQ
jgi:amino acid permease